MQILSFQFHLAPFYKANNADSIEIQRQFFFSKEHAENLSEQISKLFSMCRSIRTEVFFFLFLADSFSSFRNLFRKYLVECNRYWSIRIDVLFWFLSEREKKCFEGQIEKLCDRCLNVFLLFFYSRY